MTNHVEPVRTYATIWILLLILTGVTTGVAYVDLGAFSVVVALAIAFVKMMLVALVFMHVRHSAKLTKLAVSGGLLWLVILLGLGMMDFMTRGLLGTLGR